MFIAPDEHLIVLDMNNTVPMSDADLDLIEQAGVRTIHAIHGVWKDQAMLPRYVGRFKVLMPFYWSGESMVELYENRERVKKWARECVEQSNPNLQFFYALPDGGEFLWDAVLTKNFPLTDEQIAEFVIDIQRILVEQHGEIWLTLHNSLGDPKNWNNLHLPYLYRRLRDEFPNTPFYSFQYAYFSVGGKTRPPDWCFDRVREYTNKFDIRFFVGPDYCEGLLKNFPEAVKQKAWGYILGALHAENPIKNKRVEPWMVGAIQEAQAKFKEHYHGMEH